MELFYYTFAEMTTARIKITSGASIAKEVRTRSNNYEPVVEKLK